MKTKVNVLVASFILAGVTTAAMAEDKVFFILPNTTTTRFENRDAPLFVEAMKKKAPNAKVIVQNAQGNPAREQRLVEDAIAQGAKVIMLTSADSNLTAGSLAQAEKAKVPVVLYDHDAAGGKSDAYVVFDSLAVGQAQGKRAAELISAMKKPVVNLARIKGNQGEYGTTQYEAGQDEFIQPLVKAGKVKVVCEQYTHNWDPIKAKAFAEDCLTRTKGDVDVFLGMNDGTAGGAVAALIGQGFKPGQKVVTGGQDATVEALRYLAQGWQDNTVLKDLKIEASNAADIVASILAGKGVPMNLITNKRHVFVNGKYMDLRTVMLPVSNITKDNLSDVVNVGMWTWAQVCQGIEKTFVCEKNKH